MTEQNNSDGYKYSFGFWLRRYRTEVLELSQRLFARKIKLSEHALRRIEKSNFIDQNATEVLGRVIKGLEFPAERRTELTAFATGSLCLQRSDSALLLKDLPPLIPVTEQRSTVYVYNPDSIEMHFNFPRAVQVACEQYLLYFIDFLRDVGIEATASIRENAGTVLFSVTPKNKDQALDNIREALAIYLHLPTQQVAVPVISSQTSIELQRLTSQILHLQSQIVLSNAIIQQKEAALQEKEIIIKHQQTLIQQQTLTGQVLLQSLQDKTEDSSTPSSTSDIAKIASTSIASSALGAMTQINLSELLLYLKSKFNE